MNNIFNIFNKSNLLKQFIIFLGCVFIFKLGFFLQSVIEELIGHCCFSFSIFYLKTDFFLSFTKYIAGSYLVTLIPSLIFVILSLLVKRKIWFIGALFGALSLIIYDVIFFLLNKDTNVFLSVFLDCLGGPIAGILSFYWIRVIDRYFIDNNNGHYKALGYVIIGLLGELLFVITFYLIFLYPLPQDILYQGKINNQSAFILNSPYENINWKYKESSKTAKQAEKLPIFKSEEIKIDLEDIRLSSMGSDIGTPSVSFIDSPATEISILGLHNCNDISSAIKVFNKNSKNVFKTKVDNEELSFSAIATDATFKSNKDTKASLYLNYDERISRTLEDKISKFLFWKKAVVSIPLKSDTFLFLQGRIDPIPYADETGYIPEDADDFDRVSLKTSNNTFTLPLRNTKNGECTPFNLNTKSTNDKISPSCIMSSYGFLIKIHSSDSPEALMKLDVPAATWVNFGDSDNFYLGKKIQNEKISSFEAYVSKGILKVGNISHEINGNRLVLIGNEMVISDEKNQEISIRGNANFVTSNKVIINKSFFGQFDWSLKAIILSLIMGIITFIIKKSGLKLVRTLLYNDKIYFLN